MSHPSQDARPSARRRRAIEPIRWLREYTRHHGVWTPGVKLMRNHDLKTKAAICLGLGLVVLGLPLQESIRERWHTWRHMQIAQAGLAQTIEMGKLGWSLGDLSEALLNEPLGRPVPPLEPILAKESSSYAQLMRLTEGPDAPGPTKRAAAGLTDTRSAFLNRLNEAASTPGTASPRVEALTAYRHQLQAMRLAVGATWSHGIDADPINRELRLGIIDKLAHAQTVLRDIQRMGLQLYAGKQSSEFVQTYGAKVIEARLLFEQAQPHVDMAVADGALNRTLAEQVHDSVHQFIKTASAVARSAGTGADPDGLAMASVPASVFLTHGQHAVSQDFALLKAAHEALSERIEAQREALIHDLLRDAGVVIVLFALTTYLMLCAFRVLNGGLRSLHRNLDSLGQGKLAIASQGWGRDEIGQSLSALGLSAQRFARLLEAVTQGVAAVSQASKEVATGNSGLSSRTGDMREAIHHVSEKARIFSSAMDECGTKVSTAADHVRAMRADAQRSQKAMSGLRDSMSALQGKSREIAQVVELVETVAYQTKLLSLNASVEAARAGVAGKGFAIVAQEVRALARRSEDAARKIHTIVNSSINEIEEGTLMTARASEAVEHTGQAIAAVDQIMADIVRLTHTGVTESQEVLGITRDVENSADGNARLVDQLSSASGALKSQGDSLKRSVRHFVFG